MRASLENRTVKSIAIQALSFSLDLEDGDEEESVEDDKNDTVSWKRKTDEDLLSFKKEEENTLREELRQQWAEQQQKLKEEEIDITFSYWDGSGHRRTVRVKKGKNILESSQTAKI
ncbi:hypothetical protein NQ317_016822 [Molorchus minor]|uniref:Protein FAM50 homolog n=1 Tax=Molorchus minor TaxID=1323400 RepID=A0ABQ9ISR7_9CUCU|nr:hypothetical protein NQ317_016822 [Molorchus minor]